jgi:hypothetical protein
MTYTGEWNPEMTYTGEWRPASDPPEPGVPVIILVINEQGKPRRLRAQYSNGKSLEVDFESMEHYGGYDEEADVYWCPVGWFETNEHEEVHWQVTDEVTHWTLLPELPTNTRKGGDQ